LSPSDPFHGEPAYDRLLPSICDWPLASAAGASHAFQGHRVDRHREDADVFFILTTNQPDQLEPALASRPGRIDQAVEFPLPDEDGRTKLVRLYSRGLDVPEAVLDAIVRRTKGASPAFIKELMRRSAQFQIELATDRVLRQAAVDAAVEEMIFSGGALNLKLLGGSATDMSAIANR
jgi:SpoVK/Ycf46/Vps4 family AAA+-type ATPase